MAERDRGAICGFLQNIIYLIRYSCRGGGVGGGEGVPHVDLYRIPY